MRVVEAGPEARARHAGARGGRVVRSQAAVAEGGARWRAAGAGAHGARRARARAQVAALRPGDRAVPLAPALGTWRAGGVFRAEDWHAVPPALPDAAAATLCIKWAPPVRGRAPAPCRAWGGGGARALSVHRPPPQPAHRAVHAGAVRTAAAGRRRRAERRDERGGAARGAAVPCARAAQRQHHPRQVAGAPLAAGARRADGPPPAARARRPLAARSRGARRQHMRASPRPPPARPDWDDTVAWLQGMGADVVTREADAKAAAGRARARARARGRPPAAARPALAAGAAAARHVHGGRAHGPLLAAPPLQRLRVCRRRRWASTALAAARRSQSPSSCGARGRRDGVRQRRRVDPFSPGAWHLAALPRGRGPSRAPARSRRRQPLPSPRRVAPRAAQPRRHRGDVRRDGPSAGAAARGAAHLQRPCLPRLLAHRRLGRARGARGARGAAGPRGGVVFGGRAHRAEVHARGPWGRSARPSRTGPQPGGAPRALTAAAARTRAHPRRPPRRLQTFPLSRWRDALAANAAAHRNSKVAFVPG